MPKKKVQPEKWPFRIRGLYVILAISLLLNAIALSFIGFLNSKYADYALLAHTADRICSRDYDWFMEDLRKNGQDPNSAAIFAEATCLRDVTSGQSLFENGRASYVDGHLEVKLPMQ